MATQFQEGYLDELPDYKEPTKSKNTAPKFKEGYLDELEDNVPSPSGTEAAPVKGVVTTSTNPYGKMGADEEALFSPDALRITPQRLPKPVEDEFYGFIAQNKKNQNFSQKDIDNFWTTRGYAPTAAGDKFISAVREGKDTGGIDYSSWDKAQQDKEDARMKRAMEDFSKEAYQGDYASAVDESTKYGFWGITSRTLKDWFDTNKDDLRKEFPNASDEELERLSDQDIIRRARAARQYYQEANEDSGWAPWLAGQFTGAVIDPTSYIAPGASTGGRIAGNIGAALVTESVFEGIDAAQGLPSGQAGENIALAGAFGGAIQGLVEVGGKLYRRVRSPQGEALEEVINPTQEEIAAARLQQEADAFQARKGQEEPSALEQEAQAFQPSREPTLEDVFPTPEQTAAKEAAMAEKLASEAEAFKARGQEAPVVEPEAPAAFKVTADQVRKYIGSIISDWTNAPEIEVVQSARELGDDVDLDALGFIGDDGKVRIIADNLQSEADIFAVLYHEALGHHGLDQKFGEGLDNLLNRMYKSEGFKKTVDDWLEANPQYKDLYADDPNPQARIVEEYLVSLGESGQLPPPNLLAAIKFYLKELGRKMKIKGLEYTDSEVMTILGMAHNATINGKPNAASNGFRYAKTYHGSPADFDQFDHNYMGSGEGQQVFGWGTYLSDSEGIARSYRDKLSENRPTWGGMETSYYNLRDNATAYARSRYGENGNILATNYVDFLNETHSTPKSPEDFYGWLTGKNLENASSEEIRIVTDVVNDLNSKIDISKKGKLYEVEIPDDADWVDWNFQPTEKVQKAFEELGIKTLKMAPDEVRQAYAAKEKLTQDLADVDEKALLLNKERKSLIDEVKSLTDPAARQPLL